MLSLLMQYVRHYLSREEEGVETLEWIAVGVAIVVLIFLVYPGALQDGITNVINAVVTALTTNADSITTPGGGS